MNPPPGDGPVPTRIRIFGMVLLLASLAMGYYFLYEPLVEAQRTGTLVYYMKGVLLTPSVLYLSITLLVGDMRDGQIKQLGPDGKKHLTSKGWAFVVGYVAVLGLALAGWSLLLHHLGFQVF